MSRPAKPEDVAPKVRLNLELTPTVRARLDELQTLGEHDSLTEVVRRALALYDVALVETKTNGGKMFVRRPDGSEVEIVGM